MGGGCAPPDIRAIMFTPGGLNLGVPSERRRGRGAGKTCRRDSQECAFQNLLIGSSGNFYCLSVFDI